MLCRLRIGSLLWRSSSTCCQSRLHTKYNGSICETIKGFTVRTMWEMFANYHRKSLCIDAKQPVCQRLVNRSLVRISGTDASSFLQGLITNDMKLFDQNKDLTAICAMLLNPQGRVLYDLIIYKMVNHANEQYFLIECDKECSYEFVDLIQKFKIRKKVEIVNADDEFSVWAALSPYPEDAAPTSDMSANAVGVSVMINCSDPRITEFGRRLITSNDCVGTTGVEADDTFYRRRRYQIGLSEGILDLPPRECFPLESNAVFLNAVSFSKGCYIGQELTARTHHTGVIRKRLMPVEITSVSKEAVQLTGMAVENSTDKKCGKLRSEAGSVGLALLRISDVIHKGPLQVKTEDGDTIATIVPHIPYWWHTEEDEELKACLKLHV